MTKSENNLILFMMIVLGVLILVLSSVVVANVFLDEPDQERLIETRKEYVYDEFLTRKKINDIIDGEDYFFILGFYTQITGNREISQAIIDTSLEEEVPVNLAFAIAFVESSFEPEAKNESNNNNTIDRGLFQLNSATFGNSVDYFDVSDNTETALEYLVSKREKYESWESAIVMYNAGVESNLSNKSMTYLSRTLQQERKLDERFNTFRRSINNNRNTSNEE